MGGPMPLRSPVSMSASFSPLSALYASRRPLLSTWKTRLDAVVSAPPPMPPPPGVRHRIEPLTASQATSAPRAPAPSSGLGPMAGGAGAVGVGAGRTVPVVAPGRGLNGVSTAYEKVLSVDVGT